jgi:ribosomal protein L16 Arg81 hydroxylase
VEHSRDPSSRRDALQRLLAPLDVDEFIADYWNQRSIHIRGHADKFTGLFDSDSFFRAIEAAEQLPAAAQLGFRINNAAEKRVPAARAAAELAAGGTLCVSAIDVGDTRLAELAAELKSQLGFVGRASVHAYSSPAGTGYSFLHFDARIATTIQLAGRKRWRYAERPTIRWPQHNGRIDASGAIEWHAPPTPWEREARFDPATHLFEVILEPGDVLCLPAGTVHSAEAVDGHSLSLNVNFNYRGFFDVIADYLMMHLASLPAWRDPPPPLTHRSIFPDVGVDFVRQRLGELRSAIDSLDPSAGLSAPQLLHRAVQTNPTGVRVPSTHAREPIQPDETLSVVLASCLRPSRDSFGALLVTAGGAIEIYGVALIPFLEELVQHRSFVASDATCWTGGGPPFAWDALQPILASLVERGVLGRQSRSAVFETRML